MLNKIIDTIKILKYGLDINKVFTLDSQKKYQEALSILKRYTAFMKKYEYLYPDYYAVLGSVLYKLNFYEESSDNFNRAIELLQESSLSSDDKNYLQNYIAMFMVDISEKLENKTLKVKYEKLFQTSIYDEKNVKKMFLINFPL